MPSLPELSWDECEQALRGDIVGAAQSYRKRVGEDAIGWKGACDLAIRVIEVRDAVDRLTEPCETCAAFTPERPAAQPGGFGTAAWCSTLARQTYPRGHCEAWKAKGS